MRTLTFILALTVVSLALSAPAVAQEGHPVKGTWLGDWGPSATHTNDVFMVMDWDGQNITGMINPGTDNIPIRNATINFTDWTIRFEAQGRDRQGNALNYVIEGKFENLAMYNRAITGTWRHQSANGPFKITRQ